MADTWKNKLVFGDNLPVLRNKDYFPNECIDLIYLDPPFNSNVTYNVLFNKKNDASETAQITAFRDTWHWGKESVKTYDEIVYQLQDSQVLADLIVNLKKFLGSNDMMAYLVMMAIRLVELRRVLSPTGSIYLHCDPTASHYLKLLMDAIFSPISFVNEIIWKRYGAHNDVGQGSQHWGRVHDVILFYSKTPQRQWHQIFVPLNTEYVETTYRYKEPDGRLFRCTPLTGPGGEAKGNPVYEWKGHTRAWRYNKTKMEQLDQEGLLYYSKTGYVSQKKLMVQEKRTVV